VLEPTKAKVLARDEGLKGRVENVGPVLETITSIAKSRLRSISSSGPPRGSGSAVEIS
jgi:hypothetical protein